MKLYVQWSRSNPIDWEQLDSGQWAARPTKADPVDVVLSAIVGDTLLNGQPGWPFSLNVQGVEFDGYDHFAVEDIDADHIRVTVWEDEPLWYLGRREGYVYTFGPLTGNTNQTRVLYAEGAAYDNYLAMGPVENTTLEPWANFPMPPQAAIKHGIWLSDAKVTEHIAARTSHGWREWI